MLMLHSSFSQECITRKIGSTNFKWNNNQLVKSILIGSSNVCFYHIMKIFYFKYDVEMNWSNRFAKKVEEIYFNSHLDTEMPKRSKKKITRNSYNDQSNKKLWRRSNSERCFGAYTLANLFRVFIPRNVQITHHHTTYVPDVLLKDHWTFY